MADFELPPPTGDSPPLDPGYTYEDTLATGESAADGTSGTAQQFEPAVSSSAAGATAGKKAGGGGKSAIFSSDKSFDKTLVLLLDSGKTYCDVSIIPVEGGKEINNAPKHKGGLSALISGVNIQGSERTQQTHTLGEYVFLYTFGEGLYTIYLSGLGFMPCGSDTPAITDLIDFYDKNTVGKHGKYCKIKINSHVFLGYLVYCEIGMSMENPSLAAFKFVFNAVLQ